MYNLKITSDQGQDDRSASRTSSSKPSGAPRSDKDFKKILGDKDNQDDESKDPKNAKFVTGLDGNNAEYEELAEANAKPKQPSLFDLSKGNIKKKANDETANVVNMASADELPMESPTSIFKNLALKEKAAKGNDLEESAAGKMEDEEGKVPSRFPQESIDLSYVNPLALNTSATASIDDKIATPSQKMTTQQLVEAIAKAISTIQSQDKTDTVVTLKYPPLFAGSNLILTSYETAKGEFNIRFENLTQQAKAFMDMQQNQDSLRFALQEKGYAVHIVVATTQIETPQIVASAQPSKGQDAQQDQEQKQQQGRSKKDEEEA